MPDLKHAAIALDLGGTKIAAGLVSDSGKIISRIYLPTLASEGPEVVIERMQKAINKLLRKHGLRSADLKGLGIAVAGVIDKGRGVVTFSPNLPGWQDVPLLEIFTKMMGCKVFVTNDASAAALGEYRFGAGIGFANMIYITVSTGIGGGIIINGCLYEGADGCAGEIGHMIVAAGGPLCSCGNRGCLEALASGTAITRSVINQISQGEPSCIPALVDNHIEDIDARVIGKSARQGDSLAISTIREAGYYLGIGLINLIHIFNPQLIVIGGGISNLGGLYLTPARKVVRENAFSLPERSARIVRAGLGRNSGVIGAACLALFQDNGG